MISQALEKARKYEEEYGDKIAKKDRPEFHLSSRAGWMNDPNGFSFYDGQYHLFYQYYPYESKWGPMHWAHAVSTDLLHWEYKPAALAPDESYDKDGCFSGSAITLEDGRHLLMYTGVAKETLDDGSVREVQTQCLAVGDGEEYVKYSNNPIITSRDIPEGSSKYDFRDPKIWRDCDGTYYAVVANRPADGSGQILLYESKDAFDWKFKSVLLENKYRFGNMWECPDMFELDGKWVLLVNPVEMLAEGHEYHNGHMSIGLIGDFDKEQGAFKVEADQSIDQGIDFYATQTTETSDGRRVLIGWMQNWGTTGIKNPSEPWFGQMTIPRELSVENGRLYQNPIRELEDMRTNQVEYKNQTLKDTVVIDGIKGRMVDIELTIRPEDGVDLFQKFAMHFAQDDEHYTAINFRPYESTLEVDRKHSGSRIAVIHQSETKVNFKDELKLRIILDRYSAEIFINDGEQVMTITMYTDESAEGISFVVDGIANVDIIKYDLR